MPKKKSRDSLEKQSQRFVETAKALGFDDSANAFERAFRVVTKKSKLPKRRVPRER